MPYQNANISLIYATLDPFYGRKVTLAPVDPPDISASFLTVKNPVSFFPDTTGSLTTASVVAARYTLEIEKPLPVTEAYVDVFETGSYIISASVLTGSAKSVTFNFVDIIKDPEEVKVTVTPYYQYPLYFSGSYIVMSSTSSMADESGSVILTLAPANYQVDALWKGYTTTFYIAVPATGSNSVNAKDHLISKPVKPHKVRL